MFLLAPTGYRWKFSFLKRRLLFLVPVFLGVARVVFAAPATDLAEYSRQLRKEFPQVCFLTTAELQGAMNDDRPKRWLFDVRSEKEFVVSRIPGAIRVTEDPLAQMRDLAVPKDAEIVVYCSVGYRSAVLADKLQHAGFENVRNLEGSIFGWANEGRPLVNGVGSVRTVHPFSRKWGRFLERSLWMWTPETQ